MAEQELYPEGRSYHKKYQNYLEDTGHVLVPHKNIKTKLKNKANNSPPTPQKKQNNLHKQPTPPKSNKPPKPNNSEIIWTAAKCQLNI